MAHPEIENMIHLEHLHDIQVKVAYDRLIQEAYQGNRTEIVAQKSGMKIGLANILPFLARLLGLAGRQLLLWSCKMQNRYEYLKSGLNEYRTSPCP